MSTEWFPCVNWKFSFIDFDPSDNPFESKWAMQKKIRKKLKYVSDSFDNMPGSKITIARHREYHQMQI